MQATVTIFINIKLNPIWTQGVVPIARLEGFRDLKLPIGVFQGPKVYQPDWMTLRPKILQTGEFQGPKTVQIGAFQGNKLEYQKNVGP